MGEKPLRKKQISGILLLILLSGVLPACNFQIGQQVTQAVQEKLAITLTPEPANTSTEQVFTPVFTQTETQVSPGMEYDFLSPSPVLPSPTISLTFTQTLTPTITSTPTEGPSPTFTRRPSSTPTRTNTPIAPFAYLRISKPGQYSKVVSPIKLEAMVSKGEDGFVYIDLIGEDQRLINSLAFNYSRVEYSKFLIVPEIEFEIAAVAETARLVVSVRDLQGRVIALSSVDLILLSVGRNELEMVDFLDEPYIIQSPSQDETLSGGRFVVSGKIKPVNSNPIFLELIDESNQIVGITQIQLPYTEGDYTYHPFTAEIDYDVSERTPVRLTIFQQSAERLPGVTALGSITLFLNP